MESESKIASIILYAKGESGYNLEYFLKLLVYIRSQQLNDQHIENIWKYIQIEIDNFCTLPTKYSDSDVFSNHHHHQTNIVNHDNPYEYNKSILYTLLYPIYQMKDQYKNNEIEYINSLLTCLKIKK